MLILKSIHMKNICQFAEQFIEFDTGLSAVCGRNGSGKSTLLRALAYGLTGVVDGMWGTQKDLQKDGATGDSYVEVVLTSTSGAHLTIRRYAIAGTNKATQDTLRIKTPEGSVENYYRRSSVNEVLSNLYGIPCRLLFQIFWLKQSEIDLLLVSPAAFINSFLQEVFDMKNLETVRDKLKNTMDNIATGLHGTEEEITAMQSELDELPDDDYLKKGLDYVEEQLADSNKEREDFIKKYGDLADLDKVDDRCKVLRADLNKYTNMLLDARHVVNSFGEPPPMPESHATRQEMVDGIAHAQEKIRLLRRDIDSKHHYINAAQKAIENWEQERNKIKEQLQCPDKCELCGGEIKDKNSYMQHQCRLLTGEFDTFDEYDKDVAQRVGDQKDCIMLAETELKEMSENLALLEKSEHLLQTEIHRWDDDKLYRDKLAVISTCNDMLSKITPELSKLENLLSKSDEIRATKKQLDEATAALHEAADKVKAEAARITERRRSLTEAIEKARKRLSQEQINKEARAVLKELRDGLSANRVQARYLASKIKEINKNLAHFMQYTGMPFSLYLREDTHTFSFSTPDGFEHPTMHLSGAQKNMSAVALQMALFNVIKPQINLFLIDEPSEALDDSNKVVMADMFRRMNNMLAAMNGSMLIVSRDEKMIESCETVITVGAQ